MATGRSRKSTKLREKAAERQNMRCYYCNRKMRRDVPSDHELRLTAEHLIPLKKGGRDDESNIVASCFRCNNVTNMGIQLRKYQTPKRIPWSRLRGGLEVADRAL